MNQRGVEAEEMWHVLCHSHSCQSSDSCPIKPHPKEGGRGLKPPLDKTECEQTPEHWLLLVLISKFRNN